MFNKKKHVRIRKKQKHVRIRKIKKQHVGARLGVFHLSFNSNFLLV